MLSQHLWLIDEPDHALRLLDAAQQRARPHPMIEYSRANALRNAGRLKEATDALERAIALAPDDALAHWTLAYHEKADPPGSRVARVRAALEANAHEPLAKAHLHYALYKELEDAGDDAAAFRELEAGARLMRAQLRYDAAAEAAGIDALRALPAVAPPPPGEAFASHVPIFVVGMPRTGTTVLERILGNHPHVASAGELNAFVHALSEAGDLFVSSPPTRADGRAPGRCRHGRRWGANTSRARSAATVRRRTWSTRRRSTSSMPAGSRARCRRRKILCLVREPVDACFSNFKELFSGDAYAYSYDLAELGRARAALRRRSSRTGSARCPVAS